MYDKKRDGTSWSSCRSLLLTIEVSTSNMHLLNINIAWGQNNSEEENMKQGYINVEIMLSEKWEFIIFPAFTLRTEPSKFPKENSYSCKNLLLSKTLSVWLKFQLENIYLKYLNISNGLERVWKFSILFSTKLNFKFYLGNNNIMF